MLRRKAIKMSKARAADLKQFSRKDDDIRASLWEGGGARSVTEGERGRKEGEDATPLRFLHTQAPPPPMAEPPLEGSLIYSFPP